MQAFAPPRHRTRWRILHAPAYELRASQQQETLLQALGFEPAAVDGSPRGPWPVRFVSRQQLAGRDSWQSDLTVAENRASALPPRWSILSPSRSFQTRA